MSQVCKCGIDKNVGTAFIIICPCPFPSGWSVLTRMLPLKIQKHPRARLEGSEQFDEKSLSMKIL